MLILSGDVGGTNTRLQLTEFTDEGKLKIYKKQTVKNREYVNFTDIIAGFFQSLDLDYRKVNCASFGVAGPVIDQEALLTNLPWVLKADEIKQKFSWEQVTLINDFEAIGYGLDALNKEKLLTLQEGVPQARGVKSYIGAGTGLGVGFITYFEDQLLVNPTEGGHMDFAPANNLQIGLLRFLRSKYQRVSYERVVSGVGITNIYEFLCTYHTAIENQELKKLLDKSNIDDNAPLISRFALEYHDSLAIQALEIFIGIYGAVAGNLALTTLPLGGLYLVGGIAPRLVSLFNQAVFIDSFNEKGRMTKILQDIPVYLVLDPEVGLCGAAIYAKRLYSSLTSNKH